METSQSQHRRLDYRELAIRYDLGTLKVGGDFQLENGDFKLTRDGDLQLGNTAHNALHRLVVRWQFNESALNTLYDFVFDSERKHKQYQQELDALAARWQTDREAALEDWHRIQHEVGVEEFSPEAYAGTIMVVSHSLLHREWLDLGQPDCWATSQPLFAGRSFGTIVEAAANNFRHFDEWAATAVPDERQLKSKRALADVLGIALPPNGQTALKRNVCPEILRAVTDGSFETFRDNFFKYARGLTPLASPNVKV